MQVHRTIKCNTSGVARTSSTFLLTPYLRSRLAIMLRKRSMSLPNYLSLMVNRYGPRIKKGLLKPSRHPKRLYQKAGCGYEPKNFVPPCEVWIAFTQLARFLNWSNCYLFAVLLQMDSKKIPLLNNSDRLFSGAQNPSRVGTTRLWLYAERLLLCKQEWIRKLGRRSRSAVRLLPDSGSG